MVRGRPSRSEGPSVRDLARAPRRWSSVPARALRANPSSADTRVPNLPPEVLAGYLDAPDTLVAGVIDGVLSHLPRPRPRHAPRVRSTAILTHASTVEEGGPGGWVFLPELHVGAKPDIVVPELAGWRRERVTVNLLAVVASAGDPRTNRLCGNIGSSCFAYDIFPPLPSPRMS